MSLYKRAFLFLIRKKSKTIVLLLILTIISTLVLTCLSIGRAANIAAADLRESLGGYFKIEPDYDGGAVSFPNDKLVRDVLRGDGIKAYNGMSIQYLMTNGLQLTPGRFTSQGDPKAHMARFLANTDSSLHEYFYLRSFKLTDGRDITPDDCFTAVISSVLAAHNNLSVGDTFTASYPPEALPPDQDETPASFDYTVVGIYDISSEQTSASNSAECDIQDNFIFTDTASQRAMHETLSGSSTAVYSSGVAFFVKDPRQLGVIVGQLPGIDGYDWDGFKIIQNNKAYRDTAVPLERLSGLILTFLMVIVVISVVMLSLILVMWMRDRKYEIGILLSVGVSKAGIIAQHIAENLIIAVLAFLLAWGISSFAANRLGDVLLGGIVEQTQEPESNHMDRELYYDPVVVQSASADELLAVQVGVTELLLIFGMGFLIVVISTGLSSVMVIRMKPKEILSSFS